jgi:uncharacterized protein YdaU (DUF1376 family)
MARKPDSLHVLPLFCDDLIASCVDMTPACFGAYMRLLCFAWTRGGIPDNEAACGRIAGGIGNEDWQQIRARLTVLEDGRLSHDRLERERSAVSDMREERSKAGSAGGRAKAANVANGKQTFSKPLANGLASGWQTPSKSLAPNPSPSLPVREEETHTHTGPAGDFRQPGWAADEWQRFVAVWNATERAEPWPHLTAPDGWTDLAASPGWLQRAREALARLPSRAYFNRPLPVTRFFDFVDRIRAGEFADPKFEHQARSRSRQPAGGNL